MGVLRTYVFKDVKLKLLSVILAVLLWFAISYIGESKMSVSVPITTGNPEEGYMVTAMDSEDVLVTINGPVSVLKNMKARDIKAHIELSNVREGKHTFSLLKEDIQAPKGVQVEQVKPDAISITISQIVEKRLKTVVILDKKWIGQYMVKSWNPVYITVVGPKNSLSDKTVIETQAVDGNFQADVEEALVALNPKNMIVKSVRPNVVKVILRKQ